MWVFPLAWGTCLPTSPPLRTQLFTQDQGQRGKGKSTGLSARMPTFQPLCFPLAL